MTDLKMDEGLDSQRERESTEAKRAELLPCPLQPALPEPHANQPDAHSAQACSSAAACSAQASACSSADSLRPGVAALRHSLLLQPPSSSAWALTSPGR